MTVIAPFVYETFSHEPYCTVQEILNSPTAASVDFTNLIPDTSLGAQNAAIEQLIVRSSQMADNFVYGALGTLCATSNTENGRYRTNRYGQFVIQPYYWPILELQSFSAGVGPGDGMTSVPLSTSNVSIERYQFIITPQYGLSNTVQFSGLSGVGQWGNGSEQFCQWTYINGFANAFTTTAAVKGATSIQVTNSTGIYPGSVLTIWDGIKDENITIASTYDGVDTTLPLVSGLQYSHTAQTNVSALPATVKQAVIHFVVAMVKERGSGALVINELGEPVAATGRDVTHEWDLSAGYDLLEEFKQVWGRA
jgi:hypothetical protein